MSNAQSSKITFITDKPQYACDDREIYIENANGDTLGKIEVTMRDYSLGMASDRWLVGGYTVEIWDGDFSVVATRAYPVARDHAGAVIGLGARTLLAAAKKWAREQIEAR